MSLAVRYLHAIQSWAWWDTNNARLKGKAYLNLAVGVKANGLTSVFQAPRNQMNSVGYLIDTCEAYCGRRDCAALLRERGAGRDANYCDGFASNIAARISASLFDTARSGFLVSDADLQPGPAFYAGTICQVFPQAFGMNELSACHDKGWACLDRVTPNWQDGYYDAYPWAGLGFVAATRGAARRHARRCVCWRINWSATVVW